MVRRLTSVVDANPFFAASCCFFAEISSCTRMLQTFLIKTLKTPFTAFSGKVLKFGSRANVVLKISRISECTSSAL